jgi:hypothetical protein
MQIKTYNGGASCFTIASRDTGHISSTIETPEFVECCLNPVINLIVLADVDLGDSDFDVILGACCSQLSLNCDVICNLLDFVESYTFVLRLFKAFEI